uniref:ATP synthase complex subunit 8 n=1 Tax=Dacus bivittatus TaxID=552944 RepID=A0A6G5ZXX8_9MUSC|nr:ATP synthase F0 subunit 8 [Dacus bivittatus]QHW07524.1 ATP synthase F0 subunit 8 [Dacus bivittatus]
MPQMAPIGWLSLFIVFSITFILFSIINFYSVIPQTPTSHISKKHSTSPLNWKW